MLFMFPIMFVPCFNIHNIALKFYSLNVLLVYFNALTDVSDSIQYHIAMQ